MKLNVHKLKRDYTVKFEWNKKVKNHTNAQSLTLFHTVRASFCLEFTTDSWHF